MESRAKVLLVDDEEPILRMLAAMLERDGFAVATACSAAAGTAALAENECFDAVVTDLRMESPLAGFDVVRAARRLTPRPVIVILTAFPVPTSEWAAAGADALWLKGSNTFSLCKQLRALLMRRAV